MARSGFRAPRAPRTRGFRLATPRARESLALERSAAGAGLELPPFVRWATFLDGLDWRQGQHVTLVGGTGAGKTTLARQLLPMRDYVVVLATKARDPSLYEPLQRAGYVLRDTFDPDPMDEPRVIFRPPLSGPTAEGRAEQREAFRQALVDVFATGNWCVYADEVRYLTEYLNLKTEFETLWLQGRSLGISVFVSTQRPVSIPILAFDANHLFFWRTTDRRDIQTMAEFTGTAGDLARFTIPRLPLHEALYINTRTDEMARTKVTNR